MRSFSYFLVALLALLGVGAIAQQVVAPTPLGPNPTAPAPTVAAPVPAGGAPLDAQDVNAWLDGYIPYALSAGDIAGAVVVVVKDGQVLTQRGYGLAETLRGLELGSGPTLSGSAAYKAAVSSLGNTPISAYVDGASALSLAEALVPRSKTDFWEAVPYLKKIEYLALGAGPSDELATAKLIACLEK